MKLKNTKSLSSKHNESLEAELLPTFSFHVNQSAKLLYHIKKSLYELVKLNVSANLPSKKYDTPGSILSGSKRNLDDLRRVESILRGYLVKNNASQIDCQDYNEWSDDKQKNHLSSNISRHTIQSIPIFNSKSKPEIQLSPIAQKKEIGSKLTISEQRTISKLNQQITQLKNQLKKYERAQAEASIHNSQNIQSKINLSNPQGQKQQPFRNLNQAQDLLENGQSKLMKTKSKIGSGEQKGQFHDLRLRNKQCLDLIGLIKKEINGKFQEPNNK